MQPSFAPMQPSFRPHTPKHWAFLSLGFAKPVFCNPVLFTKKTGITKPTKTAQTATQTRGFRERKMRTNFFCTNFSNTARGPGHPGKNPGTSQIPFFETQGRQSFEGGHEVFDPHPFAWKTPTPPGGLRTQKVNLCALFSCLRVDCRIRGNHGNHRNNENHRNPWCKT